MKTREIYTTKANYTKYYVNKKSTPKDRYSEFFPIFVHMDLDNMISDLLFRYNCVVVPGFGAFLSNYKFHSLFSFVVLQSGYR